MYTRDDDGITAFMLAAKAGQVEAMRVLLDHPSANAAVMMMQTNVRAQRLMVEYAQELRAAVVSDTDEEGTTALMMAAKAGQLRAMCVLLDHPSANAAVMMTQRDADGATAFVGAAEAGQVEAMRLLLDHPRADPAAMMVVDGAGGRPTALVAAAGFAAGQGQGGDGDESDSESDSDYEDVDEPIATRLPASCAPLLLLLRRVAAEPRPSDAQQAHMSLVMEAFCQGPLSQAMLDDDESDAARDECICLLLEHAARGYDSNIPAVTRIVRELAALARVPQRINEAVLGMAFAALTA
ncbi:hypothetical protein FOA52_013924 [Chlamydomonas sp. UWO 241]|nr:hypothetical protein FOA52_013924 [Chlamydomonas sp. UWO 241]